MKPATSAARLRQRTRHFGVACSVLVCLTGGRAHAQQPDTIFLAQVRSRALVASPEITAARAAVAFSERRLAVAGLAAPMVLSGEVEEVPDGYRVQDGSVHVVLEKTFLAAGHRAAARGIAEAEHAVTLARLAATERRVLARTDLALVRAFGWAALANRLVEQDSLLVAVESALRTRFSVGEAGYVDVLRVRTERLRVQASLSQALAESRAARRGLEGILPPEDSAARGTLARVDERVAHAPAGALRALLPAPPGIDSLMQVAAVIRLAEAEVQQARAQHDLVLSAQRPQLSGFVGAQRFPSDNGSHTVGPRLGIAVSLPFAAAGTNRTAREAAQLQVVAAEAGLAAARATLRADLRAARERYDAALARLGAFDAALLQAARLEREGALAGYRSGQLSLTELLDFERGLSLADSERIQSEIAAAEALADLIDTAFATGDGPRPDVSVTVQPGGSR
jgi:outer membrane protein, heavy metal efflux system